MKVLFCGDIVGRSGRDAVLQRIPTLRQKLDLDFVFANAENAAGGFGITPAIAREFYEVGVDCLTTGNHVWDQRELLGTIDRDSRMVRPANFPAGTPGRGATLLQARGGRQVLVVNIMARLFMDALDDPFAAVDKLLADMAMPGVVDAIIVDFHGEASSEKMAMGHHLDGRVTLVVGTHTHIPTADLHILRGGTAYQTDAGMCGDYNSVIGMDKEQPLQRFVRKIPTGKFEAAQGEPTLCGVYLETDDKSGLAKAIAPLRMGGRLAPVWPV